MAVAIGYEMASHQIMEVSYGVIAVAIGHKASANRMNERMVVAIGNGMAVDCHQTRSEKWQLLI